jgi:hypothetical protein
MISVAGRLGPLLLVERIAEGLLEMLPRPQSLISRAVGVGSGRTCITLHGQSSSRQQRSSREVAVVFDIIGNWGDETSGRMSVVGAPWHQLIQPNSHPYAGSGKWTKRAIKSGMFDSNGWLSSSPKARVFRWLKRDQSRCSRSSVIAIQLSSLLPKPTESSATLSRNENHLHMLLTQRPSSTPAREQ